jgi:hypothetical protein
MAVAADNLSSILCVIRSVPHPCDLEIAARMPLSSSEKRFVFWKTFGKHRRQVTVAPKQSDSLVRICALCALCVCVCVVAVWFG